MCTQTPALFEALQSMYDFSMGRAIYSQHTDWQSRRLLLCRYLLSHCHT
jgi:hypothetical protein